LAPFPPLKSFWKKSGVFGARVFKGFLGEREKVFWGSFKPLEKGPYKKVFLKGYLRIFWIGKVFKFGKLGRINPCVSKIWPLKKGALMAPYVGNW